MAFVRQLVAGLDRPVTLGGLAEATSRQFGTSATANWGGFNKFKKLLEAACPDVTIDDGGASWSHQGPLLRLIAWKPLVPLFRPASVPSP